MVMTEVMVMVYDYGDDYGDDWSYDDDYGDDCVMVIIEVMMVLVAVTAVMVMTGVMMIMVMFDVSCDDDLWGLIIVVMIDDYGDD